MPLPFLVVEVPAQDRAAPETSALIEACTKGLAGGRCALTQDRDLESVSAIAIVSWRDREQLNALVEVGRVREPTETWRSEELRFKPEDQRIERFRTLGLAIAVLFRGTEPEHPGDATGDPVSVPATSQRAPVTTPRKSPKETAPPAAGQADAKREASPHPLPLRGAQAWASAGAIAFYDPELAAWRYGGRLAVSVGARQFPGFLSAFGSYAVGHAPAGVSLSWSTLGLGPGLRMPLSPGFELRGVAQGLLVDVSGTASEAGRTSSQSVWVPGAGVDLEIALRASEALSATLAGGVQRLAGSVPIREHNEPSGTVGKTALGAELELELRLF